METSNLGLFSVRDFGAAGDGQSLDSPAIQAAIDRCAAAGGGTVYFPAGDYLSGTLNLGSGVGLKFGPQARLLGSTSLSDYQGSEEWGCCLIHAEDVQHVGLSGEGTIDGQGAAFPCGAEGFNFEDETAAPSTQTYVRPTLIHFRGCTYVNIQGLTLQHAAAWCCHIEQCKEVVIEGVHLFNRANQNNDGFDLTTCEDVRISNCHVDCGDDAFALKEGGIRIVISNCVISTRWAAFRIGPEARGVFRDIAVSNCVIYDTYGSGIKIQEVEGGIMENILFDNLVMENVTGPISIRLGGYLGWKNERKESLPIGTLRNIRFQNIRARVADNAYPLAHEVPAFPGERKSCINISGVPGFAVENITLSGVHVTYPGGGSLEDTRRMVPELRDHYPEYHMFGVLPAYGLYARHTRGLVLEDVRLDVESPDLRPALFCEDVEDLELSGFRAQGNPAAKGLIRLAGSRGVYIHGSRPLSPVKAFVFSEDCQDILLDSNDLRLVQGGI